MKSLKITTFVQLVTFFIFTIALTACELQGDGDESSTVPLRTVEISCLVLDLPGCSLGLSNNETLRVGIIDDCDTFNSSSEVYAVAEGTLNCDTFGCDVSAPLQTDDFSPSAITPGTYDLYAFFDYDNDNEPDTSTEPIGCLENVEYSGSTSTVTISDWF